MRRRGTPWQRRVARIVRDNADSVYRNGYSPDAVYRVFTGLEPNVREVIGILGMLAIYAGRLVREGTGTGWVGFEAEQAQTESEVIALRLVCTAANGDHDTLAALVQPLVMSATDDPEAGETIPLVVAQMLALIAELGKDTQDATDD